MMAVAQSSKIPWYRILYVQVLLAVPYALARALELAAREGGVC